MSWKGTRASVLLFFILSQLAHLPSQAWSKEGQIPDKPSTPPSLQTQVPTDAFRCQRFFVHRGKRITCDSNIRLDGENLRPILRDTPQALAELDRYQRNRLKSRQAAYIGSVGLFIVIAGSLFSLRYQEQANNTANSIRNVSVLGGGGIMIGSFLSALSFIRTNETHIGNAVKFYNDAHPETPIELQFNTGIHF